MTPTPAPGSATAPETTTESAPGPSPSVRSGVNAPSLASGATPAEDLDGIVVIRAHGNCRDWNGITYRTGMSAANVGSTQLSMNVATIPPGGVARAHIHVGFDLMLYILEGHVRHEFGDNCEQAVENGPGDFIYIKPDVPHEVFNMSDTDPVVAVVARAAADEWDRIVPYERKP